MSAGAEDRLEDMEDVTEEEGEDVFLNDEDDGDGSSFNDDEERDIDDAMNDTTEESVAAESSPQEEEANIVRRQRIMAVMADSNLTEQEKRLRIHAIMNTASIGAASATSEPSSSAVTATTDIGGSAACVHYERNCSIVAPCCNLIFGCRICHDELSPSGHPPINRYLIREVVCKGCNTRQSASYV
jgi:hypothetical protein